MPDRSDAITIEQVGNDGKQVWDGSGTFRYKALPKLRFSSFFCLWHSYVGEFIYRSNGGA